MARRLESAWLELEAAVAREGLHRRQVRQHVAHKIWLSTLAQETTYLCPCGKHMGVKLLDQCRVVEENLCPVSWWVTLSQVAYEMGRLGQFRKDMPMDKFLCHYALESSRKSSK